MIRVVDQQQYIAAQRQHAFPNSPRNSGYSEEIFIEESGVALTRQPVEKPG
ncbi:MAG: hypothetical protein IKF90_04640 [Parasporobacterium sp.]|nr:hypothetical protein [Parasporobacterium sp.]